MQCVSNLLGLSQQYLLNGWKTIKCGWIWQHQQFDPFEEHILTQLCWSKLILYTFSTFPLHQINILPDRPKVKIK